MSIDLTEYDPKIDYMGPNNCQWLSGLISRFIQNVDCNPESYAHDVCYAKGGSWFDKIIGDLVFWRDVRRKLAKEIPHGKKRWLAMRTANRRGLAVLLFGRRCFNFHKTKPQQTKPKDEK